MLKLSDFDYNLPPERIAQTPLEERDQSRLMVVDRAAGKLTDSRFATLPDLLRDGDVLVINDTRVNAVRLFGARPGHPDEKLEVFLTTRIAPGLWHALVRPGRKLLPGTAVEFGDTLTASVLERIDDRGGRLLQFETAHGDVEAAIEQVGLAPLPPYITTPLPTENRERYQTVYARHAGSSAAPTAGLHFTPAVLERIAERGVDIVKVTLHVGLGTFRPIQTENIEEHSMHSESVQISDEAAEKINTARGRVVAVGTTALRTLEASAIGHGKVRAMHGETSLYITPGYDFQVVQALVTNFHMPRSTLLVLVSAFAGYDLIKSAYQHALDQQYRFLSFGDAMFIA